MVTVELQYAVPQKALPTQAQFQAWADVIKTRDGETQIAAIRVVNEQEMTVLNKQYRQKKGPTNVLSFPAQLHEQVDVPFIGDIVICAPIVINEAKQQHKTEESHWAHMMVHGILHLQGYDHINDADAMQMESLEIQIMHQLGYENPYLAHVE